MARLYELSQRFVDQLIKEMEKTERYPEDTILRGKGYVLVEEDAFRDYLKNRAKLKSADAIFGPAYARPAETPEDTYLIGVETR